MIVFKTSYLAHLPAMEARRLTLFLLAVVAQPSKGVDNCTDGVNGEAPAGTPCVFPATYLTGAGSVSITKCGTNGYGYSWCCVEFYCAGFLYETWGSCGACEVAPPPPPEPPAPPVPVSTDATYVGKGVCRNLDCETPRLLTYDPDDRNPAILTLDDCISACVDHTSQACIAIAWSLHISSLDNFNVGSSRLSPCYLYEGLDDSFDSLRGTHDLRYSLCPDNDPSDFQSGFVCYTVGGDDLSLSSPPPTPRVWVVVAVPLVGAATLLCLALAIHRVRKRRKPSGAIPMMAASANERPSPSVTSMVSATSTMGASSSACASSSTGDAGSIAVDEGEFSGLRFDQVVGRGGFADVWRGSFRGSDVAVKVLHQPNDASSIDAAVQKEAALLTCLRHPSICTFYGVCPVTLPVSTALKGIPATPKMGIVLEYLAGGTLSEYLKLDFVGGNVTGDGVGGNVTSDGVDDPGSGDDAIVRDLARTVHLLRLALQVASGLQYLHSKAIIHRDIKASNILLDASFTTARVADFGLSRLIGQDAGDMDLSGTHKAIGPSGTIRYLAPETATSLGAPAPTKEQPSPTSPSSMSPGEGLETVASFEELLAIDTYAWGYLLYEILHERVAFPRCAAHSHTPCLASTRPTATCALIPPPHPPVSRRAGSTACKRLCLHRRGSDRLFGCRLLLHLARNSSSSAGTPTGRSVRRWPSLPRCSMRCFLRLCTRTKGSASLEPRAVGSHPEWSRCERAGSGSRRGGMDGALVGYGTIVRWSHAIMG